jgi:hypothetical protein
MNNYSLKYNEYKRYLVKQTATVKVENTGLPPKATKNEVDAKKQTRAANR